MAHYVEAAGDGAGQSSSLLEQLLHILYSKVPQITGYAVDYQRTGLGGCAGLALFRLVPYIADQFDHASPIFPYANAFRSTQPTVASEAPRAEYPSALAGIIESIAESLGRLQPGSVKIRAEAGDVMSAGLRLIIAILLWDKSQHLRCLS